MDANTEEWKKAYYGSGRRKWLFAVAGIIIVAAAFVYFSGKTQISPALTTPAPTSTATPVPPAATPMPVIQATTQSNTTATPTRTATPTPTRTPTPTPARTPTPTRTSQA